MKESTQVAFALLLFSLLSVTLHAFVFSHLNTPLALSLSAVVPIVLLFLADLIEAVYQKIKRALKVERETYKERRKKERDFRDWFYQNHKKSFYEYDYPYRDIAKNNFKIEKLQKSNEELSQEYYDKRTKIQVLDDEVINKLSKEETE